MHSLRGAVVIGFLTTQPWCTLYPVSVTVDFGWFLLPSLLNMYEMLRERKKGSSDAPCRLMLRKPG